MKKEIFIYRRYLGFLIIIPLTILFLSIFVGYLNYIFFKNDKKLIYMNEAVRINSIIENSFNYITRFSEIVGEKIISNDEISPIIIGEILKKTYSIAQISEDNSTLTKFDFVTEDGRVIANVTDGMIKIPPIVKKNDRNWMILAPKDPWKLHISPTIAKGILRKGQIVDYGIPTGFGISTDDGRFLGTVSAGVDIHKLVEKIKNNIDSNQLSFIILNDELRIIAQSNNNRDLNIEQLIQKEKLGFSNKSGILNIPIKFEDYEFQVYQRNNIYPFIVLIGDNKYILRKNFQDKVFPSLILTASISILLLILFFFFFFRNQLVIPLIKLSDIANAISRGQTDVNIPKFNSYEISVFT